MITILVKAADGTMIASAQSAEDARLCIDRAYEDGDTVEILTIGSQGTVLAPANAKGEVEVQTGILKLKALLAEGKL